MATISASDFRNGVTFEYDGELCQVIEFQHVKPGKGAAFVRRKIVEHLGTMDTAVGEAVLVYADGYVRLIGAYDFYTVVKV